MDRKKIRLTFFFIAFVDFSAFWSCSISSRIVFMGTHHIEREIKEAALKMFQEGLSDQLIEQFLGVSGWAMRWLRETYHATGDVVWIPACSGQPCLLDSLNARVCLFPFSFRLNPNYYFSFLRAAYCASLTWRSRNCRHISLRLPRSRSRLQQSGGHFGGWDIQWRQYVLSYKVYLLSCIVDRSCALPSNKTRRSALDTKWILANITNRPSLSLQTKALSIAWRCGIPMCGLNEETAHIAENFLYGEQGKYEYTLFYQLHI